MPPIVKPNGQGLTRIINALRCSYKGFIAAFRYEDAFRQELVIFLIALPMAWLTSESIMRFAGLMSTLLLLLIVELLNSAVEAVVDRTGLEYNELAGRAKDLGSAAVFTAFVLVGLVWGCHLYLFWKH